MSNLGSERTNARNLRSRFIVLGLRWCSIPSASWFATTFSTPSISKNSNNMLCFCLTLRARFTPFFVRFTPAKNCIKQYHLRKTIHQSGIFAWCSSIMTSLTVQDCLFASPVSGMIKPTFCMCFPVFGERFNEDIPETLLPAVSAISLYMLARLLTEAECAFIIANVFAIFSLMQTSITKYS